MRGAESSQQPGYIAQIIDRLLRNEFAYAETVMLTLSVVKASGFSERDRVGNFSLRRFTGKYDLSGNQILTTGQIIFDSIRRFKGQQAPAVILVDAEPDPGRPELSQRLLYTGITRPMVRLELKIRYSSRPREDCSGQ